MTGCTEHGGRVEPDERDGYEALRAHVVARAQEARRRHGPRVDEAVMRRILADPELVRFPTDVAFDAEPLQEGEFAWVRPRGEQPAAGFTLVVHPCFEGRPELFPLIAAYHVVAINYLDVATHHEAELYGATLLGLEVDDYYERVCALADSVPGATPPEPDVLQRFESLTAGAQAEAAGGGCGCG